MSAQTEAVVVGMVTKTQILEDVTGQTQEDLRLVETWMVRGGRSPGLPVSDRGG